jgi:hypothetical protein
MDELKRASGGAFLQSDLRRKMSREEKSVNRLSATFDTEI